MNWGSTQNNGTVQGAMLYAGGPASLSQLQSFSNSYTYDRVNRLTAASDSGSWSRQFSYDAYGNMWVPPAGNSGVPLSANTPTTNSFSSNQMTGPSYDKAGNQTSANGNTATYDAENRMVTVTELPAFGGSTESLYYDGAGQRVEKVNPSGTTIYVYDAFGRLGAEYTGTATTPLPCRTCYLTYDHLGSLRMVTDPNGTVVSRHDYLPFGEEIPAGSAGRGSQFGATDNVIQRFTPKDGGANRELSNLGL